jgi:hypothetical protein
MLENCKSYREALEKVRRIRSPDWQSDPLRQLFEDRDRARLERRGIDPDSEEGARCLLPREFRITRLEVFARFVLASERLNAKRAGQTWQKGEMLIIA